MPALLFDRAVKLVEPDSLTSPVGASTSTTSTTLQSHPSSSLDVSDHTRKIITAICASILLVILLAVVGTVIYRQFWRKSSKREARRTTQVVIPSNGSARSSQETLAVPPSLKDGLEGNKV